MPLFVCEACRALENTALGWYWARKLLGDPRALCCVCAPRTYDDGTKTEYDGRWHGEFPRRMATRFDGVINPEHLPPLYDHPRKQTPPNAPNTRARKRRAQQRARGRKE